MQKIRILLYTDHDYIVDHNGPTGLSDLMRFILHKTKGLYDVELTALNRHISAITKGPAQGANKLSWGLLSAYDELWVFGRKQINLAADDIAKAEPYNELDGHEILALEKWMNSGGGLLFTGDHSEPNPTISNQGCDEPGRKSFLNLGRALGQAMPRAKQLRVWEGPPTYCSDPPLENVNTQVKGNCSGSLDSPCHQDDEIPQTLLPPSAHHELFRYVNSKGVTVPIEVLPDHMHEGKVQVPDKLDSSWPSCSSLPKVVARGIDKRPFKPPREYDLVIAYDGHSSNVGRIVADSSFHHFINKNLANLVGRECCGTPIPDSHLDQIGHYFSNLVLWLAPKATRDKIIFELPFRLAKHHDVLEARGGNIRELGGAAKSVASAEWGNSNLYQLFAGSSFETDRLASSISMAFLDENIPSELRQVQSTDILGWIVREYHEFFRREQIHSPGLLDKDPTMQQVIGKAMTQAFRNHPLRPFQ